MVRRASGVRNVALPVPGRVTLGKLRNLSLTFLFCRVGIAQKPFAFGWAALGDGALNDLTALGHPSSGYTGV